MSCYREKAVDRTYLTADTRHGNNSQAIVNAFFINDCADTTTLTAFSQACTDIDYGSGHKEGFIPTTAGTDNLKTIVAVLVIPSAESNNGYVPTNTYSP